MRVRPFLHKLLSKTIHNKRINVLSEAVESALMVKHISLTGLGRGLNNGCQERSNIRKMDRLLGNAKLSNESRLIYQSISRYLLKAIPRPVIIVDAVKLPSSDRYALRACCTMGGRSHTLYELIYPKSQEGNIETHRQFLQDLKFVLPENCKPIIVTDAGFHNPWFKEILQLGWDFIGRIRGLKIYKPLNSALYSPCAELWEKATHKATCLGKMVLNRNNPLECYFYTYKKYLKGRITKATKDNAILHYKRAVREPWLLASSLDNNYQAIQIIQMYAKRMKIEESFRDMKSSRYGLGLDKIQIKKFSRYTVILLIVMLTNLIACLIGHAVELKRLHLTFQANSTRCRRVLSYFYLGCQAFKKQIPIRVNDMNGAYQATRCDFLIPKDYDKF